MYFGVIALKHHRIGLIAAIVATCMLALTVSYTLGSFTALIDNNTSNFSSGSIAAAVDLREGNGTTTCNSTSGTNNQNTNCAINALVGTLDQVPGGAALTSTITLTSTGASNPTTAGLTTGACTAAAASDASGFQGSDTSGFCGKVDVTIANTTPGATDQCVYPMQTAACPSLSSSNTLAGLANTSFSPVPLSVPVSGTPATYVVTVQLDASATNTDQELCATLPFSWGIS